MAGNHRSTCRLLLCIMLGLCLFAGSLPQAIARIPAPALLDAALPAQITQPPAGKYLFVELWLNVYGTGTLPILFIDFPGYEFNPTTGVLKPFYQGQPWHVPGPADWGLTGNGESRSGTIGGGIASGTWILPSLPYSTTLRICDGVGSNGFETYRYAPVILQSVDEAGALTVDIDGEHVVLALGQSWSRVVDVDVKTNGYDGHYHITSSVTNYGWQERSRIYGPHVWLPVIQAQ